MKTRIMEHFAGDWLPAYNRFLKAKYNGRQAMALCPFHPDSSPSLSIDPKTGLFKCFGCGVQGDFFNFYAQLKGIDGSNGRFGEVLAGIAHDFNLAIDKKPRNPPGQIVATYDYTDELGQLLFQVCRLEPKSFRQRKPDGKGGWKWNVRGVRQVIFNLPAVLKAPEVLIVEGEKDVLTAAKLGLTATCNAAGAGKWNPAFADFLAGKDVVLVPDNDPPGKSHMQDVGQSLKGKARSLKWLDLPGIPEKGDLSDFVAGKEDPLAIMERLSILIENAPAYEPPAEEENPSHKLRFLSLADMVMQPRPIEWLIKPYLDAGSLAVLYGEPGSMKSFVALDLGLCVATGDEWHGNLVRVLGPVFYIAGEGFAGMSRRLKALVQDKNFEPADIPFFVSNAPMQTLSNESVAEVVAAIDKLQTAHGAPVLIIVDTLNRNFGPGDENSTADMTKFISSIDINLRSRYGCAVLVVHHSGLNANDRARGASALKAALDWEYRIQVTGEYRVLMCTKSKDHEPPPAITLSPETIRLEGWVDPDDKNQLTSCVLRRVEGSWEQSARRRLSGAQRIALEALMELCSETTAGVYIEKWREMAYRKGVSLSTSQDAKKKAFQRAVSTLLDAGYIDTTDDFYWIHNGTKRDISGTSPPTSRPGQTGTPPL